MIWVDREVKKIKERKLKIESVDDMKTPSGRIHVGSLRGVIVHDLLYKVLLENKVSAKFSYVFNDMDPMDAVPSYLDQKEYQKYAGFPLFKIPSPVSGYDNFAQYFAKEFVETFEKLNCHPQIVWSSKLYAGGKMNSAIKEILDKADKVREIYKRVANAHRADDWFPYQVICENCGKVGTTYVYRWDGKYVWYRCQTDMVVWAQGCNYKGKIQPINTNGKLVWKLDWPAHWKVIGVTIECSGKDHMSKGGSYDMGQTICREVLNYPSPYAFGYEWFTVGGKKMSSSKGIGTSAKEVASILPPDIFRFFLVRSSIDTHLDFDPYGDTIPKIFDDYDRCMRAYFDSLENIIPEGKEGEVLSDFARIIQLSPVRPLPQKRIFIPRFRTVANILKNKGDLLSFFEKQKGEKLNSEEREILEERELFAQVYLKNYTEEYLSTVQKEPLATSHKEFLKLLAENLKFAKKDKNDIKKIIFNSIKQSSLAPKIAFKALYQTLLAKEFGPKAVDLILEFGLDKAVRKLEEKSVEITPREKVAKKRLIANLNNPDIFSIDKQLAKKFASIKIGVAIIKNVIIEKTDKELENNVKEFIQSQQNLTTKEIGEYKEIQSYRRIYKEMGVDWHSRRPSPEALLRRIALKKGLYSINTCVDAYNLVVMKYRVSSGAFDLDKIKFPTILRFPKEGEQILLLGDKEATNYTTKEVAYFDQVGGYNIDFNYRDAQRTAVTEKTKNLLINIDGVYDITIEQVEQTLQETIENITKYCGGKVELTGIVQAQT